jgi:cytochrome b pre-mRNA-processing protein 3
LTDDSDALAEALSRNILDGGTGENARRLAAYARTATAALTALDAAALLATAWRLPSPLGEDVQP